MKNGIQATCAALGLLTLFAWAAPARSDGIQQAIDRGVAYLKSIQQPNGKWPHGEIGATALAGLALLECDEKPESTAVQNAAQAVRQTSISLTYTYSLALSILFLDRLGDPRDVPLIESMAVRLLAGQNSSLGWHYHCPRIDESEVRRLSGKLKERTELRAKNELPHVAKPRRREFKEVSPEIQQQIGRLRNESPARLGSASNDNSNTQFAIMGLWVARRHGIPVNQVLARVETRFRISQNKDGGWGYTPGAGSNANMTCAGLLGLATAYGLANEIVLQARETLEDKQLQKMQKSVGNPGRDAMVLAGLNYLGGCIGHPISQRGHRARMSAVRTPDFYFLWALERVAVAYGLKTIHKKDWYAWGSELALATQCPDGSWRNKYGEGGVDTSFALLFLKRANLASDLSTALRGVIQDPGEHRLSAGDAGGRETPVNTDPPRPKASGKREEPVVAREKPSTPTPIPAPKPAPTVDPANDPDAARLSEQLVQAAADQRDGLLDKYEQGKGTAYTEALARAISQLKGTAKTKAREALAKRLSRMTAQTLKDRLKDDDVELRRAAALACAMKEDKGYIEVLIPLLEDEEKTVTQAARAALKELSGKDFGPSASASRTERREAAGKWRDWWRKESSK
jgi:hypothetical protein